MSSSNNNEIARARRAKYRKARWKRIMSVLAVIAIIFVCILSVSFYSSVFSYDVRDFLKSTFAIGSFPVEIEDGAVQEKGVGARTLYMLNGAVLKNISGTGAELLEYHHSISNPGLAVSGNRAVVYSRGGKSYKVFNRTMMLFSGSTSNPIISVAVTPSGKTAFLTSGEVYTGELTVFDRKGDKIFTWYGSEGFPTGVYASSYRNSAVILGVKSINGALFTTVCCIDLDAKTERAVFELEGMPLKALLDNDSVIVFLDSKCVRCDFKGQVLAEYSYNGRSVLDIRSDSGKNIAIAFGDNKRSEINSIVILTRKLSEVCDIDHRDFIEDMWVSNDRVFVLSRGKIDAYSHAGLLQEIYHCDISTYSIVYFGGVIRLEPRCLIKSSRNDVEEIE